MGMQHAPEQGLPVVGMPTAVVWAVHKEMQPGQRTVPQKSRDMTQLDHIPPKADCSNAAPLGTQSPGSVCSGHAHPQPGMPWLGSWGSGQGGSWGGVASDVAVLPSEQEVLEAGCLPREFMSDTFQPPHTPPLC